VLEPTENLLLIQATPDDYADLVSTLRMIDRPRQQVMLNSIIAEVRLNDTLEYGVEYFLRAFDLDGLGIMEVAGGASDLLTGVPTASAFFTGADGFAIIQALETVSEVHVLAQPQLTSMDGQEARILVGGRTPVPEGNIDTATGGLRNDITYEEIGIELRIATKINESGDVTLFIQQSINDVVSQGELGPEFTSREIDTHVTVPHGHTLLIGGIIEVDSTISERKIPFLADIPGLGAAFKSVVDRQQRNELLLAITPTIVNSPGQGHAMLGEFLQAARGIERALYTEMDSLPRATLNANVQAPPPPVREELGAGVPSPDAPSTDAPAADPSAALDAAPTDTDEAGLASEWSSTFVGPIEGPPVAPSIVGVLDERPFDDWAASW
jgi:general secretion pathway protein D